MDPSDLDEEMAKYDGLEDFSSLKFDTSDNQPEGEEPVLDT